MKRFLALVAVTVVLLTTLLGCLASVRGSGVLVTEEYDFADFTRLEISNAFQVEVVPSASFSVVITADDNLSEFIRVSRSGRLLRIRLRSGVSYRSITAVARVEMPALAGLDLSGASRGTVTGFQSSDDVDFRVSGASTLRLVDVTAGDAALALSGASNVSGDLTAGDIEFEVSGASRVDLTGSAADTMVRASGASRVELPDLPSRDADVRLSGASRATVRLDGRLSVNISGASHLEYIGQPTLGTITISGASTLNGR